MEIPTKEYVLENVTFQLVSNEKYYDALMTRPFINVPGMDDVAAIYNVPVEEDGKQFGLAVNDLLMEKLDITSSELENAAMENIKMESVSFTSIEDMMNRLLPNELNGIFGEENSVPVEESMLCVLTNETGFHGARVLLKEGLLEKISERLGDNLIILPSSIHEVLIVRESAAGEMSELRGIVQEINKSVLSEGDFLSDNIYKFDAKEKELSTVSVTAKEIDLGLDSCAI